MFIFTRPDLKFLQDLKTLNWDYSKFNILIEHLSSNCDDNLWVFPTQFFDAFEKSIDSLNVGNRITHEINHELIKNSVPIKYYSKENRQEILGHTVFEICK